MKSNEHQGYKIMQLENKVELLEVSNERIKKEKQDLVKLLIKLEYDIASLKEALHIATSE